MSPDTPNDPTNLLARAEALSTSVLCDFTRDLGHPSQALATAIQAIDRDVRPVAGWAHTVLGGAPPAGTGGPDHAKARAIDAMGRDDIAVFAGDDVQGVCVFGGLLALTMQTRGVRAAVVDGGVRDVDELRAGALRTFARYRTPRASTGFYRVQGSQVTVTVPGALGPPVAIAPGDLVVADTSGVLCIPRSCAAEVIERAEAHARQEEAIRDEIMGGARVDDLLTKYGRI